MYSYLLEQYINKLTKNDVLMFAKNNDIYLTDEELNIVFDVIKNKWQLLVYNDPTDLFKDLKSKFNINTYNKIVKLYNDSKEKYQGYL